MCTSLRTGGKKNLLLAFDAFGTLFTPRAPVATQYGEIARKHGVTNFNDEDLLQAFRKAFRDESRQHPNYGKAVGMDAPAWWGNVITKTFRPFLAPSQLFPDRIIPDLLHRFSTEAGYTIFPDVLPFFTMLREIKSNASHQHPWPWEKTIVGIVTNSDDRVPDVLKSLGLTVGPRKICTSAKRISRSTKDDDISFVVLSYDVGFEKPHFHMFQAAQQLLKETLAEDPVIGSADIDIEDFEKLYVGDDMRKDYLGAKNAGWNAIYLDRKGHFKPHLEEAKEKKRVATVDASHMEDPALFAARKVDVVDNLGALKYWRPGGQTSR